jgi:mRNA interferase HicA
MRGREFIERVKELARERSVQFRFDPIRGKGSHGTIWYGTRFTVVPNPRQELKKGTLGGMCRQLGIRPHDLRDR